MSPASSLRNPSLRLAALRQVNGYRFNADLVELTGSFGRLSAEADNHSWVLQLWACGTAPTVAADIRGQLVASTKLPPFAEITDSEESFSAPAFATPPVGNGPHVMVLVLAAATSADNLEVHDFTVFPRPESFILPRFLGRPQVRAADGHALITASIENPRDTTNASGTLSLELWALPQSYSGGAFAGTPIAGASLGSLGGQQRWTELELDLVVTAQKPSTNLVLMLREWTSSGFVTRDFVNLAPLVSPHEVLDEKTPAAPRTNDGIDVNSASYEELAAVKGLSRPVAKAIVQSRPFQELEELRRVKGLGPKVLERVRRFLRIG